MLPLGTMSPRVPVRSILESVAHIRWRRGIRTVVVAPAVAVIVGMAIVVSNGAADELRRSAEESAIHNKST
jgi:hypothetical protein